MNGRSIFRPSLASTGARALHAELRQKETDRGKNRSAIEGILTNQMVLGLGDG